MARQAYATTHPAIRKQRVAVRQPRRGGCSDPGQHRPQVHPVPAAGCNWTRRARVVCRIQWGQRGGDVPAVVEVAGVAGRGRSPCRQ
eukprot:scaffold14707_cov129-Isochrysis_galbana.AAC.8